MDRVACAARFWFVRYGPQDLAAASAAVLGALLLAALSQSSGVIATGCACLEWTVFYAVAGFRNRRRRGAGLRESSDVGVLRLVREYGVAELVDLALRPCSMHVGLILVSNPALGILAGSLAADAVFYAIAASCLRRFESA